MSDTATLPRCIGCDRPMRPNGAHLTDWPDTVSRGRRGRCGGACRDRYDLDTQWQAPALQPCGTPAAYGRHLRKRETPCDDCREARRVARAEARRANPQPAKPRELRPCGTSAAYDRHIRAGETPCEPCLEAAREASREARRRARKPRNVTGGGTYTTLLYPIRQDAARAAALKACQYVPEGDVADMLDTLGIGDMLRGAA